MSSLQQTKKSKPKKLQIIPHGKTRVVKVKEEFVDSFGRLHIKDESYGWCYCAKCGWQRIEPRWDARHTHNECVVVKSPLASLR